MAMRAFRGATMLTADDAVEMAEAVTELLAEMMRRNEIEHGHLVSVLFTATPDLHCAFPAAAARGVGMGDVPLICAQELDIVGAPEKVVRVMIHAESDRTLAQAEHVYLRGAIVLRQDLAQ